MADATFQVGQLYTYTARHAGNISTLNAALKIEHTYAPRFGKGVLALYLGTYSYRYSYDPHPDQNAPQHVFMIWHYMTVWSPGYACENFVPYRQIEVSNHV